MKWTLLYFDDLAQNIEAFKELLSGQFEVIGTSDALSYPKLLEDYNPHAILMDVHMPVLDGHELYKKISSHPLYNGCPVIFISGDQSDENRIKSFEGGGIDFLPRDLRAEEIVVRLVNNVKYFTARLKNMELGNLVVNVETMQTSINGKNVDLTLLELRMLSHILRQYPHFMTRAELIERVWGGTSVKPGTINTHLTNLKPKIAGWDYVIKVREENILVQPKTAND